jgi:hypothetical protein
MNRRNRAGSDDLKSFRVTIAGEQASRRAGGQP